MATHLGMDCRVAGRIRKYRRADCPLLELVFPQNNTWSARSFCVVGAHIVSLFPFFFFGFIGIQGMMWQYQNFSWATWRSPIYAWVSIYCLLLLLISIRWTNFLISPTIGNTVSSLFSSHRRMTDFEPRATRFRLGHHTRLSLFNVCVDGTREWNSWPLFFSFVIQSKKEKKINKWGGSSLEPTQKEATKLPRFDGFFSQIYWLSCWKFQVFLFTHWIAINARKFKR